jgi:hypothetical protein
MMTGLILKKKFKFGHFGLKINFLRRRFVFVFFISWNFDGDAAA